MQARPIFCLVATGLGLALLPSTIFAAQAPNPASFDRNHDGMLDQTELTLLIINRDSLKPDLNAFMEDDLTLKPNANALIRSNLFEKAAFRVGAAYEQLGIESGTPIPIERARELQQVPEPSGEGKFRIPGIYGEEMKLKNGSLGPLRLRKSAADWGNDLSKAKGAKVAYADDRESDQSTWSSEGALILPISFSADSTRSDPESNIRSGRAFLAPSVSWKAVKTRHTDKGDIEELQAQVPVVWSANHVGLGWLRNSEVALMPFALTDFSFQGFVWGVSATYAPYIFDEQSGFALNTGYKGLGSTPFLYRLGLMPTLDYNHLSSRSRFISRDDHDDYFRGGGKAEAGLITMGFPAVEALASYQGLAGITGAPDWSDLFSLSLNLWANDYVGVGVEYQRGETPVAQKDIDLISVGLEVRF